jgi:hypothetical protein
MSEFEYQDAINGLVAATCSDPAASEAVDRLAQVLDANRATPRWAEWVAQARGRRV